MQKNTHRGAYCFRVHARMAGRGDNILMRYNVNKMSAKRSAVKYLTCTKIKKLKYENHGQHHQHVNSHSEQSSFLSSNTFQWRPQLFTAYHSDVPDLSVNVTDATTELYYLPQTKLRQGNVLHLSVILFTGGGGWSVFVRGVSVRETPLYSKEREVRILLECFLVIS